MRESRTRSFASAIWLGLALSFPAPAEATWPGDPLVNVPLCRSAYGQSNPVIVPAGAGGAVVAWQDARTGTDVDIFAQAVSAEGAILWTAEGIALSAATGNQQNPAIVGDGAGGAIVAWMDRRSGMWDVYVQRISAAGIVQWTAGGVALCTATSDQYDPTITSDGAGGALVAWSDQRSGSWDIYAQRISAGGTPLWTANGVALCSAAGDQWLPVIAPDGAGGAIVAWEDPRGGTSSRIIYSRRISNTGTVQWTADGVPLGPSVGSQYTPTIIPDGAGGAMVAWRDHRTGTGGDIYSQRISSGGTVQWAASGLVLCNAPDWQQAPAILSDGLGGAIIAWADMRSGNFDVYTQRVSGAGAVQWTVNGVALCTAAGMQSTPRLVSDGAGGAIVTWQDARVGTADIFAQRVSAGGTVQWVADGVAVCTAAGDQSFPTIASDGALGALVTWYDKRGANTDIYAQRVQASGQLGGGIVIVPIGWANLQWPPALTTMPGATSDWIYGQVWIDGISNQPGPTAGLTAELGYAAHGSDPIATPGAWQWKPAVYNLEVGANDEFMATLTVATPGAYDYCFRYSFLGGTWLYADLDGTNNGYSPSQAGTLTVAGGSAVEETPPGQLSFGLQGGNPIVGSARFRFGLPRRTGIGLSIHDVTGRRVATLVTEERNAGYHTAIWEGAGAAQAGAYFARLQADGRTFIRKLIVLR